MRLLSYHAAIPAPSSFERSLITTRLSLHHPAIRYPITSDKIEDE